MEALPVGREDIECEREGLHRSEKFELRFEETCMKLNGGRGGGGSDLEWGMGGRGVLSRQTFCQGICEIGPNPDTHTHTEADTNTHSHTHTQVDLFSPLWICITKNLHIRS